MEEEGKWPNNLEKGKNGRLKNEGLKCLNVQFLSPSDLIRLLHVDIKYIGFISYFSVFHTIFVTVSILIRSSASPGHGKRCNF